MTGIQQLGTPGHVRTGGTALFSAMTWIPSTHAEPRPYAVRPAAVRSVPVRTGPVPT